MQNLLGQSSTEPDKIAPGEVSDGHPDGSWRADALGKSQHARLTDHIREPLDDADPERADSVCAEACRNLLLDFAPALMALPAVERRRCHALATYAQMLFDFAAQTGIEGERLAALNRIEFTLEQSLDAEVAAQPVFVAMAAAHQLRPWNRDELDQLGKLARNCIVSPRPQTAVEEVQRSEALGTALAACLLAEDVPRSIVELAGALVRIRSLLVLGEAIRRDRSALPSSELPGRGDIDRPIGRRVLDDAVGAAIQRIERSLGEARRAASLAPRAYRRAIRYVRLAAVALSSAIERHGWEVVSSPPRLGLGQRLACLLKARLGLG
jgi:hypothetical protein